MLIMILGVLEEFVGETLNLEVLVGLALLELVPLELERFLPTRFFCNVKLREKIL